MIFDDPASRDLLLQTFIAEARDGLDELERSLLALERTPLNKECSDSAFRAAHTLKGNAMALGYRAVAEIAHVLEDRLDRERHGGVAGGISVLLEAVDALRAQIGEAAAGREPPPHAALMARLHAQGAVAEAPPPRAEAASAAAPMLRVEVRKLDRMLALSGEIAIVRGRLRELATLDLGGELEDLDSRCRDLQDEILGARALPVGPFLAQQERTVRDAAASHGKQARVVVEGEDVEVDTAVLEALREPLVHLLRNAVAHGIETPAVRRARGKPPAGTVLLRARREPGCVVVEVEDDGGGFDRERIAAEAESRGLATDAALRSDAELFALVFEPGFTTATRVDDLSGRGVGMDAVRHSVQKLRGSVAIESREGEGSTITLRLPLTLAILDAFFVGVGDATWALPLEAVSECIDAPGLPPGLAGLFALRGEALPWLRLAEHFSLEPAPGRESLVVVDHGGRRAGIVIDGLFGEGKAVLKPLGPLMSGVRGVAGAALLGTGAVALILDVQALFSAAIEAARGKDLT